MSIYDNDTRGGFPQYLIPMSVKRASEGLFGICLFRVHVEDSYILVTPRKHARVFST
jgi:hypothetical protein